MKRFFICVSAAIMSLNLFAQVNNFKVSESGKVYWQKVFEDSRSAESVLTSIMASGSFSGLMESEGQASFHIDQRPVDVVALGYKRMMVPIYTSTYDFSGQATLQFQEGRYRVTVQDIILSNSDGTQPIETWAVSRGMMTRGFSTIPSELYDKFLTGLFGPSISPLDEDW